MVFNRTINSQTFIKIGDAYTPKLLAEWDLISDLIIQWHFVNYFNFPTYKHFLREILFLIKQEALLIKCSNDYCIPICINRWRKKKKYLNWQNFGLSSASVDKHKKQSGVSFPIKISKKGKQYYDNSTRPCPPTYYSIIVSDLKKFNWSHVLLQWIF